MNEFNVRSDFCSKTAKILAPQLFHFLSGNHAQKALRYLDLYLNVLQGRGNAGEWNFKNEVATVSRFIHEPTAVIFDVGANVGSWSRGLASTKAIDQAHFYLFEPLPTNLKKLYANRMPNWKIFPNAVGNQCGPINLYGPKNATSTLASVYEMKATFADENEFDCIPVQQVTLDSIFTQEGLDTIDFLKMDIEGHELSALKGARCALEKGRIKCISFEFGATHVCSKVFFRDFWDLLTPRRYRFSRIGFSGKTIPVSAYSEDLEYFRGATTYIAEHFES